MPEMHLRQSRFTYTACGPFTKKQKEYKNLKKEEIHSIFIKMNYIKLVFKMALPMEILKI